MIIWSHQIKDKKTHNHNQNVTTTTTSYMIQDTKMRISNIGHINIISDDELGRKISEMKNKMNSSLVLLQTQSNEAMDLMETANERYKYAKEQLRNERERANHFQGKGENLQKKLIENHNMLFEMFEQ